MPRKHWKTWTHSLNVMRSLTSSQCRTSCRRFVRPCMVELPGVRDDACCCSLSVNVLVVYVADLLWTCYGQTVVMDFALKALCVAGCLQSLECKQRTLHYSVHVASVTILCPTVRFLIPFHFYVSPRHLQIHFRHAPL